MMEESLSGRLYSLYLGSQQDQYEQHGLQMLKGKWIGFFHSSLYARTSVVHDRACFPGQIICIHLKLHLGIIQNKFHYHT